MSYGRWFTEAENRFCVPRSQWAKWSRTARVVFNDAYALLRSEDGVLNTAPVPPKVWRTMCFNMARRAADVVHVREKAKR